MLHCDKTHTHMSLASPRYTAIRPTYTCRSLHCDKTHTHVAGQPMLHCDKTHTHTSLHTHVADQPMLHCDKSHTHMSLASPRTKCDPPCLGTGFDWWPRACSSTLPTQATMNPSILIIQKTRFATRILEPTVPLAVPRTVLPDETPVPLALKPKHTHNRWALYLLSPHLA
jgi:hypothetical protein